MKSRNGYVSNSSSSSFIVVLKDENGRPSIVTRDQEAMLLGYGFKYVKGNWKTALTDGADLFGTKEGFHQSEPVAMYYDIVCNEDEVEEFLIENRIPFAESGHYGDFLKQYDGIHDYYDTYANAGTNFLRYGFRNDSLDDTQRRIVAKGRTFYRTRISDGADITDEYLGQENI